MRKPVGQDFILQGDFQSPSGDGRHSQKGRLKIGPQDKILPHSLLFLLSTALLAAPSGEAVYMARCAACHDQTNPRIPPRAALQKMSAARILRTLDFGAMMTVAYPMSRADREAVAAYIGT